MLHNFSFFLLLPTTLRILPPTPSSPASRNLPPPFSTRLPPPYPPPLSSSAAVKYWHVLFTLLSGTPLSGNILWLAFLNFPAFLTQFSLFEFPLRNMMQYVTTTGHLKILVSQKENFFPSQVRDSSTTTAWSIFA